MFWGGLVQFYSWFRVGLVLVERVPMKMAKTGHFCFCSTPLCLGDPEAEFFEISVLLRCRNPRLGEPLCLGVTLLRLGQATVPVMFFLRLILESVTLLFELSMKDN